jgi:hypothetical protein
MPSELLSKPFEFRNFLPSWKFHPRMEIAPLQAITVKNNNTAGRFRIALTASGR